MAGVKMPSCEEQDEKIKCIAQVRSEYDGISSSLRRNRFICPTDAALYYGLVRAHKPRRIIEIGARFSTVLACGAVERNGCGTVIAIDPYPPENIRKKALIVPLRVQDVPLREFTALQHGDMLFIDSSHVAQIGSDVLFEILENTAPLEFGCDGAFSRHLVARVCKPLWPSMKRFMWFLLQTSRHPDVLERYFSAYRRDDEVGPGSFWIQRAS